MHPVDRFPPDWDLIPAPKYSKHPGRYGWTTEEIGPRQVLREHVDRGGNFCNRLRADQLVIDVDPKKFPSDQPRQDVRFFEVYGIDPTIPPRTNTPNGGYHLRYSKPCDVHVARALPDNAFPGIDFLSIGAQVVAAGSRAEVIDRDPDTKKPIPTGEYMEYRDVGPPLSEGVPPLPDALLSALSRPTDPGDLAALEAEAPYNSDDVLHALAFLDPVKFRDYDQWTQLGMAVWSASGGQAREEWIDWSTQDPQFADDRYRIGRHWDSWDYATYQQRGTNPPVTFRTFHKILSEHQANDAVPQSVRSRLAALDFQAQDDDPDLTPEEFKEALKTPTINDLVRRMNERYTAITAVGNKFRILIHPEEGDELVFLSRADFVAAEENNLVRIEDKKGNVKEYPLTQFWLKSPLRSQCKRIVFDPKRKPGKTRDAYNLWTGWGTKPARGGSWNCMKDLIENTLSGGDEQATEYIYRWLAWLFQNPGEPAGVALSFTGKQGTGKGTLGNCLKRLIGRHAIRINHSRHLTGNFNKHLMDKVFIFADEAVRPTQRGDVAALKAIITEPTVAIEPKGIDIFDVNNCAHVMIASNDTWFLPMAPQEHERRYMVCEVADNRIGDTPFWEDLHFELALGGEETMLYDLLHYPLEGWVPWQEIPRNAAYTEQALRNLSVTAQWVYQSLWDGQFNSHEAWPQAPIDHREQVIRTADAVRDDFKEFCRERGYSWNANGRGMITVFGKELADLLPCMNPKNSRGFGRRRIRMGAKTPWCYAFPFLGRAREELEASLNVGKIEWPPLDNDDDV